MKKAIFVALLLVASCCSAQELATGTDRAPIAFSPEFSAPTRFNVYTDYSKPPLIEIDLKTGEASYSCDVSSASKVLYDGLSAYFGPPDVDTGLYHDGYRWRVVWRGRVIW